jgi:hypothetical protein
MNFLRTLSFWQLRFPSRRISMVLCSVPRLTFSLALLAVLQIASACHAAIENPSSQARNPDQNRSLEIEVVASAPQLPGGVMMIFFERDEESDRIGFAPGTSPPASGSKGVDRSPASTARSVGRNGGGSGGGGSGGGGSSTGAGEIFASGSRDVLPDFSEGIALVEPHLLEEETAEQSLEESLEEEFSPDETETENFPKPFPHVPQSNGPVYSGVSFGGPLGTSPNNFALLKPPFPAAVGTDSGSAEPLADQTEPILFVSQSKSAPGRWQSLNGTVPEPASLFAWALLGSLALLADHRRRS